MKKIWYRFHFLVIFLFVFTTLSFSQDLVIPKVSAKWALHTQYSMATKRERLINHLKIYDSKVNDFNARCGKISVNNTSLIAACKSESDALDKESDLVDKEVEIYKSDFDYTEKINNAYHQQKEFQLQQQKEIEELLPTMVVEVKHDIEQRKPNDNAKEIINSYNNKVPPLTPYKKFSELESGDVLLIAPDDLIGNAIRLVDWWSSVSVESSASHTITFLKEVNGQKLFLDNTPFHGPIIISEEQLNEKYANRKMDVAKPAYLGVAQPLKPKEAEALFKAAVSMQSSNLNSGNSNYGVWGKNDIVCSEASWALINAAKETKIPGTDFGLKGVFVNFSPADFYAKKQYFLVTPLK